MKRTHRRWHGSLWIVAALVVAATLIAALLERPEVPENARWPVGLSSSTQAR